MIGKRYKMGRIYNIFMVLTCLFTAVCEGQVRKKEKQGEGEGRPVRMMYFMAPAGAPEEAYVYAGTEEVGQVVLNRTNFSKTFYISKGAVKLSFFSKSMDVEQPFPTSAPSVVVPEEWQKVLLLVFLDKENKVIPIRVKAINAGDDKFGPGSIYFLNFSNVYVSGMVGERKLSLKPKSETILKNPMNENGVYPAKLDAMVKGEKKPRRFIRQMWSNSDKIRNVLFIFPKPAPMHATYYCAPIRDF